MKKRKAKVIDIRSRLRPVAADVKAETAPAVPQSTTKTNAEIGEELAARNLEHARAQGPRTIRIQATETPASIKYLKRESETVTHPEPRTVRVKCSTTT